ncbi:MAG: DNA polymerase III subunit delta [Acidimicrobiia bacterium]|nr:DNA polymerase III subunit delta [Acidimicrobiia bacterium]
MPAATPSAVRRHIAAGTPDPVYVILGEDEVEKSALAHQFEELVEDGLRAFNVQTVHPGDVSSGDRLATVIDDVLDAMRTLPIMAPRRVVIVFQAKDVLIPKRESAAATQALERFEEAIATPFTHATLVLVSGSLDKRTRVYKTLARQATLVECGALADQADAERWVRTRVAAVGVEIETAAARLLAERCGTDVKRLRNEVDRLLLYALGQKLVTVADVREIAGPAALHDDWGMANAIEAGDAKVALRLLALMLDAGAAPLQILGQIGWLVRTKFPTMAPASVKSAVDSVFRTDMALKRSVGEPRILLERLVVELCAGRRARAANPGARW